MTQAQQLAEELTISGVKYCIDNIEHVINGNYGYETYMDWERVRVSRMNKNAWLFQTWLKTKGYDQRTINKAYNLLPKFFQTTLNKQINHLIAQDTKERELV